MAKAKLNSLRLVVVGPKSAKIGGDPGKEQIESAVIVLRGLGAMKGAKLEVPIDARDLDEYPTGRVICWVPNPQGELAIDDGKRTSVARSAQASAAN